MGQRGHAMVDTGDHAMGQHPVIARRAAYVAVFAHRDVGQRHAAFDMAAAIRSPAFIVLLGIGFVNSLATLWYADERYGNTIHPVTRIMIEALQGAFTIIPLIIAIYYAGELVWRDRDRRVHEIVDATPAPDWAFIVPKVVAITLVLIATLLVAMLAGAPRCARRTSSSDERCAGLRRSRCRFACSNRGRRVACIPVPRRDWTSERRSR